MLKTDYTIISRPHHIIFECPYCDEDAEVLFEDIDFKGGHWSDGAYCECSECGRTVELCDFEYD